MKIQAKLLLAVIIAASTQAQAASISTQASITDVYVYASTGTATFQFTGNDDYFYAGASVYDSNSDLLDSDYYDGPGPGSADISGAGYLASANASATPSVYLESDFSQLGDITSYVSGYMGYQMSGTGTVVLAITGYTAVTAAWMGEDNLYSSTYLQARVGHLVSYTNDYFDSYQGDGPFGGVYTLALFLDVDGFREGALDIYAQAYAFRYDADVVSTPIPAAAWLFGSALLGLGAIKRRKAT